MRLIFFLTPGKVALDGDFHPDCADDPVEITVQFSNLLPRELERFKPFISQDGTLTVTKTCTKNEDGVSQSVYKAPRKLHPEFSEIRSAESATSLRALFNEFRELHPEYNFGAVKSQAEALEAMAAWEAANPEACREIPALLEVPRKASRFSDTTRVLFVPAIKDARTTVEQGGSPVQRLLQKYVLEPTDSKPELVELRERVASDLSKLFPPGKGDGLERISELVNDAISGLAPAASVEFAWEAIDEASALRVPHVKTSVTEDGYSSDIDDKGHGVQRAVAFALMRLDVKEIMETRGDGEMEHLIILIEEPELFQHPSAARHIRDELDKMANEENVVVAYATHSPYLVSLSDFEAIRILRRLERKAAAIPVRRVYSATMDDIVKELKDAHEENPTLFTPDGLKARLHGSLDATIREGYFAKVAVLCEGDEDAAFVVAACELNDVDLAKLDVAVLAVNGKASLDRPLVIFRKLGISTFVLFDADNSRKGKDDEKAIVKQNRALLALLGVERESWPDTRVNEQYAVFANTFRNTVQMEFGEEAFRKTYHEVRASLGYYDDAAQKVPAVIVETLRILNLNGLKSETLDLIVDRIRGLSRA